MKKVLVIILAVIAVAAIVFAVVVNNDKQKLSAEITALTDENTALKQASEDLSALRQAAEDLKRQAETSLGEKNELSAKLKAAEDSAAGLQEQIDKLTAENKALAGKLAGAEEAAKATGEGVMAPEDEDIENIASALTGVFKDSAADMTDLFVQPDGKLESLLGKLIADVFLDGDGIEMPAGIEDMISEYAAALEEAYALIG